MTGNETVRVESRTECLPPAGGIDCNEAELLGSRRLDSELDEADALVLDAHLNACPNCRAALESWSEQGDALEESLQSLWTATESPAAPAVSPKTEQSIFRPPRSVWLPMGMAASQVLALVGLSIYFVFFGSPASAPQVTERQPEPASAPDILATPATPFVSPPYQGGENRAPEVALSSEALAAPLDVKIVMSAQSDQVQLSVVTVPAKAAQPAAPQEIVMAAPRSSAPLIEIGNLSLTFRLADENNSAEQSGRMLLLGDVLHGRGAVRIIDSSGKMQEIAQADIDTLLRSPLREVVRSFIRECARPDVRARLLSAKGKGE
jgi:predicted anti-sigma-YlaC factor YlaD